MKRYAYGETSSAFSLFPFLAVLLCTMGALAVLLIAMAQVSKDKASRKAVAEQSGPTEEELAEEQRLKDNLKQAELVEQKLAKQQEDLASLLAAKQKQLSDAEDHTRRLQDEIESLEAEAMEIIKLDELHVQDHSIAEQEITRLNELKAELIEDNEQLAEKATSKSRRFAIVPLRDRDNGSRRPPIYFECVEDGVILQPEGIKLTRKDFARPVHVSSPLAAAMRAIEQHYVDYPSARTFGEEGAPYPLLVIRPGGVKAYYRATTVLESLDSDYGYQPVAADWDIEYDQPDPVMAVSVMRAIKLARYDRERLAASAPQYFRHQEGYWGDKPEDLFAKVSLGVSGETGENPFSSAEFSGTVDGYLPNGSNGSFAGSSSNESPLRNSNQSSSAYEGLTSENQEEILSQNMGALGENGNGSQYSAESFGPSTGTESENSNDSLADQLAAAAASALDQEASGVSSNSPNEMSSNRGSAGPGSEELSGAAASSENQASVNAVANQAQQGSSSYQGTSSKAAKKNGIGILRLVPLVVNQGQVTIVEAKNTPQGQRFFAQSETINMAGNPNEWMPRLLDSLQKHAASWGIAGQGMYWKSKIVLHVDSASGEQAKLLANYLRQSGVDIHRIDVANEPGGTDAKLR